MLAMSFVSSESTTPEARDLQLGMQSKQFEVNPNGTKPDTEGRQHEYYRVHNVFHVRRGTYGGSGLGRRPTNSRSGSNSLTATLFHIIKGWLVFILFFQLPWGSCIIAYCKYLWQPCNGVLHYHVSLSVYNLKILFKLDSLKLLSWSWMRFRRFKPNLGL